MQLEEGKYYLTRDGRKFGPMFKTRDNLKTMEWNCPYGCGWTNEGTVYLHLPDKNDLVSVWSGEEDQGPKVSGETIDLIAVDSLKWHMKEGVGDMEPLQLEAFRIVLRYYGVPV